MKKIQKNNQEGFALLMLVIAIAIIAVLFGTYFSKRYQSALETKKQAEKQKDQIEKQVNDQLKQFESQVNDLEQKKPGDQNNQSN